MSAGQGEDPKFPYIIYRSGAAGIPTPVLRGTGIRVQTIVGAVRYWGMLAAEVASDYDLSEAQVREALAFYTAHQAEIDAAMAAEEAAERQHERSSTS